MAILEPDEKRDLEALSKGPVRVFTYRGGASDPEGLALARRLDGYCRLGLARFVLRRGDRNSPAGDVWNVYEITPCGLGVFEASTGRHKISARELREAGCG